MGARAERGVARSGPSAGKKGAGVGRGPGLNASWAARGVGEAGGWAVRERVGRTGLSCWVGFGFGFVSLF